MGRTAYCFLLLLSVSCFTSPAMAATATTAATEPSSSAADTSYVKASCKSTTYPDICLQSLLGYASQIKGNPRRMSTVALTLSLSRAQSAYSFLTKVIHSLKNLKKQREHGATADCLDLMDDSVYRLRNSVQEMKKNLSSDVKKKQEFLFQMSNVQTWVSAALTDGNTCLDGFADKALNGKLKDSVRAQVVILVQVTSNALGLVNQFANIH